MNNVYLVLKNQRNILFKEIVKILSTLFSNRPRITAWLYTTQRRNTIVFNVELVFLMRILQEFAIID